MCQNIVGWENIKYIIKIIIQYHYSINLYFVFSLYYIMTIDYYIILFTQIYNINIMLIIYI